MVDQEETRKLLIQDLAELWHRLVVLESGGAVPDESIVEGQGEYSQCLKGVREMARATGHALGQPMQAMALSISTLQHHVAHSSPLRRDMDELVQAFIRMRQVLYRLQEVQTYTTCECGDGQRMIDIDNAVPS